MELWGAYLLLCLFSLLTQVTTEEPNPKVKKAANAKKGKQEGAGPLPIFQGADGPLLRCSSCSVPSFSFLMSPGNFSEVPPGA